MRSIRRLVAGLALVTLIVSFFGGVSIVARRTRDADSRSTYSTGSGGLAAMYRVLGAMGYEVTRSVRPLDRIKDIPPILVLAAGGLAPGRQPSEGQRGWCAGWEAVLALADRGTTVVLLGAAELPDIERHLGLKPSGPGGLARATHPRMGAARAVVGSSLARPGEGWVVLMSVGSRPVALARHRGKGWIVAFADAAPFTNERIGEMDHAEVALRLIAAAAGGERRVALEETVHGVVVDEAQSVWGRIGRPGRTLVCHALLLFAVLAASLGSRLGYPIPRRRRTPPLGEYVTALARLYEEAGLNGPALDAARRDALRRAAGLLGLPAGASEQEILHALPEHVRGVFLPAEPGSMQVISAPEAIRRCRAMDAAVGSLRTTGSAQDDHFCRTWLFCG